MVGKENLEFWKNAWESAVISAPSKSKRIRSDKEIMEYWNKLSGSYEKETAGENGKRLNEVIHLLETQGMITPESDILDVGCGPGIYTVPLAYKVRTVTALDGAAEMCNVVAGRAKNLKLDNIVLLNSLWEETNFEDEGLKNAFDLVFASLMPGIASYDTLIKFLSASRKYCCLIYFAGGVDDLVRSDLWRIIFQEDFESGGNDIVYPFNILYNLGFYPKIDYLDVSFEKTETVEEAIENLCNYYWLFSDITKEIRNKISAYVLEKADNGIFRQKSKSRLGILTWSVLKNL
ncbi:class I SAM-dependent methyltransferase [Desulfosporosinus sp.]|uniref:class I SAM-dependent methyltransferase n=1 Tax=Desulfosporosinus sp. TaxID=157907 RepID=UPI002625AD05|nr:class I SAM-dependent methyltransferase [Desulfosporosinus sp.]MCO5385274.1 class I SAM-dependent methyltransferase [Desulfosporosinus sp.]